MKTKGLAIIMVLAMLFLVAGSVYSAHPWEESRDDYGPFRCSGVLLQDDPEVIMIPIFSDFLIWIRIKVVHNGSEQYQENSVEIGDNSYQILFPW